MNKLSLQTFIDRSADEIRVQYSGDSPSHWGYANIATTSAYNSYFRPLSNDMFKFQHLHLDETRLLNVSLTGYHIELKRKVSKVEVQEGVCCKESSFRNVPTGSYVSEG